MLDTILLILFMGGLLLVNGVGVVMVALQLPGTWVMVAATGGAAWWRWEEQTLGWWPLGLILGLAVMGELIELVAGAAGGAMAGAGRRAAWVSLGGGLVGAIVGTFFIPVPLVGTLLGAAAGAGAGSVAGDRWAGRSWGGSIKGGGGAAVGRLGGAVGKLVIAMMMWVVVAVAMVI